MEAKCWAVAGALMPRKAAHVTLPVCVQQSLEHTLRVRLAFGVRSAADESLAARPTARYRA